VLGPELGQLGPGPFAASERQAPFARREDEGDDQGEDEHWVRSYLHANCSNCHRPGGASDADMDLRYRVAAEGEPLPLNAMRICNVAPTVDDLGISDPLLLAPGAPERSLLLRRMLERGEVQMPPLASIQVDEQAVLRMERWILALPDCP
jgi:hypothetical protein